MPNHLGNWDNVREWLLLVAVALSATFAGLIWWLARKRLSTRYAFRVHKIESQSNVLQGTIQIRNRGDNHLRVEAISVKSPLHLLVDDRGSVYGTSGSRGSYHSAQQAPYNWEIEPDSSQTRKIALTRDDGFSGCKKASIRLHILRSFPAIRQRTKVLTTTLPASTRVADKKAG